jgi:hypothetical protein
MNISLKKYKQLLQDIADMENAHQTNFIRCDCGRIKEQGLICPNEECKFD